MTAHRFSYWLLTSVAALLVLAGASAAASRVDLERLLSASAHRQRGPYQINNSRLGRAVIDASNVKPGQQGRGRVTLGHTGTRPIRRITLTQDKVVNTGIGPGLQLQLFDVTAKRCLYPRPKVKPARPGRKPPKEPRSCSGWMPWKAGARLRNLVIPTLRGNSWKPREKHAIEVRWRLADTSPNTDQGKRASFRLTWRASA